MTGTDRLLADALEVIDRAATISGAKTLVPLFSGGHDSLTACFVASKHPLFDGRVRHIDTGIGAKATRRFIEEVCNEFSWDLEVFRSPETYEKYVSMNGFPGPGRHQFIYNRLKDRCVNQIMRISKPAKVMLITGCRSQESTRRMGHVEPIKIGETSRRTGKVRNRRRVWTAPIHGWSTADQGAFMDAFDLPGSPVKHSPLGMSGECFCGAFARPGEIGLVRRFAPDVAEEIDRLTVIARDNGKHCVWGTRPKRAHKSQLEFAWSGPLCNSCDQRAAASGFCLNVPISASPEGCE